MDIQLIIVIVVFLAALFITSRRLYRQVSGSKKAGCAKCPAMPADGRK